MNNLVKSLITLLFLIFIMNSLTSCAIAPKRKIVKPKIVVKEKIVYKKPVYIPMSEKQLGCINSFLNRDIDIVKANAVCQDIYKIK